MEIDAWILAGGTIWVHVLLHLFDNNVWCLVALVWIVDEKKQGKSDTYREVDPHDYDYGTERNVLSIQ